MSNFADCSAVTLNHLTHRWLRAFSLRRFFGR
jgi:hypothetical protein